ncbi:MAG TPA: ECF-type sigma factor [Bryobacteraceae bacterium]|nr:ECF-type sigma factor [Bryobacteraceae bacterium]
MPHHGKVIEGDITVLLRRWREGDETALENLMPLVYPRLKEIADGVGRERGADYGLHATALVNEAFLRLVKQGRANWEGREHFFNLAALVMRQILTDSARSRLALKRGGALKRVPLHDEMQWVSVASEEMLDLNTALDELAAFDARKVSVVELRYFLGCTADEAGEILGLSKATIDREAEVARAWLFRRLRGGEVGSEV